MPTKNENGITLDSGTLYINGEKMGDVSNVDFTAEPNEDELLRFADDLKVLASASNEVILTTKMAADAFARFCHVVTGIERYMKDTCPNRKVVHLAYHARKARTRKKNYCRMIRICEKYEK